MRTPFSLRVGLVVLVLTAPALAAAVCGNGAPEAPEQCDDGNLVDGDGCDSNCTFTACGNAIVTAGEECDDGNTVSEGCCSATCQAENSPPVCDDAEASVDELWPPNHKMASVAIVGVIDPDGDPVDVTVTAVSQDEPLDATGDGATCPDAVGVGLDTVSLRSERSGQGDGRFYHVAFQAVDRCAASCTGEVTVTVPHDRSPKKTPDDGGPLYDSTLGAPPCDGDTCDPEDCVPDPDEVHACEGASIPPGVRAKLEQAKDVLGDGSGRRGAKLLRKTARRVASAALRGNLAGDCATALTAALHAGVDCVVCGGE